MFRFLRPTGFVFATQFIDKKTSTTQITNLPNAAGIGVVSGALHVHDGSVVRRVLDEGDVTAAVAAAAVAGVAAGYKVARGATAVTGTGTVITGLATVVAVVATPQSDLDGTTLAGVSATIGDQAGSPAAGSVILKAWKITAADNGALIAADAAKTINWVAIGT